MPHAGPAAVAGPARRPHPAERRPRRCPGAPALAAHGPAGDRPRGHADRVPRHDQPRDDARCDRRWRCSTSRSSLLQIPIGVIGVPLGVVLLPSLSREAALGGMVAFRRLLVRGLSILAYVMIGIAALGIVVSEDVVRLLFGVAHISEAAHQGDGAGLLAIFLVGLTAHSLIAVLARAFYALQDTKTPVARGADRRRGEHRRGQRPGRAAGPQRPRRRHRDRGLARDDRARRPAGAAGAELRPGHAARLDRHGASRSWLTGGRRWRRTPWSSAGRRLGREPGLRPAARPDRAGGGRRRPGDRRGVPSRCGSASSRTIVGLVSDLIRRRGRA